jgi:hypothetical protein
LVYRGSKTWVGALLEKALFSRPKYFASKVLRNKSLKHRHFVAGQFLSRAFVVLLRKSIPQNHNLKPAA